MRSGTKNKTLSLDKALPFILVIGGIIGIICSFIISLDKIKLLENPSFRPNCDLNPIVSCGSVMKSWQGSLFGFPNPWIGLAAFSVLVTIGMAMLAGAKFKRWFWIGLWVGELIIGMIFAYWLLGQSVFVIHALCPYCLTVDVAVTVLFWYTTLYEIEQKYIKLPKGWQDIAAFARRHHFDILATWFIIIIVIILKHFWYYYGHYL